MLVKPLTASDEQFRLAIARSDMSHISIWVDTGICEAKFQNVSCSVAA